MKRTPNWTPEQIEQLQRYAGTISCSKIGEIVGRSKDAVSNKIASLGLPRFHIKFENKREAATKPKNPPMIALFKNHEAAAKKAIIRSEISSRIEWCTQCFSPVSNWAEHFERLGHRRA